MIAVRLDERELMRCVNCPREAGTNMLCDECRTSGEALGLPLNQWLEEFKEMGGQQQRTHNGFANAETENVTLWLENYRPHYRAVNRLKSTWFDNGMDYGGERSECIRYFANAVRAYCLRQWPTAETPDGHELAHVDWVEIASHWVEP